MRQTAAVELVLVASQLAYGPTDVHSLGAGGTSVVIRIVDVEHNSGVFPVLGGEAIAYAFFTQ